MSSEPADAGQRSQEHHAKRESLEIYSRLSIADAQRQYNEVITKFPV